MVGPIEFEKQADPRFTDEAWSEVLAAVDVAYSELVSHQALLEEQNEKLHEFRRFLSSILSSVSDVMVIVGRNGAIAEVSQSLIESTGLSGDALIFADDRDDNIAAAQARGWRTHLFDGPQGWADRLVAEKLLSSEEAR